MAQNSQSQKAAALAAAAALSKRLGLAAGGGGGGGGGRRSPSPPRGRRRRSASPRERRFRLGRTDNRAREAERAAERDKVQDASCFCPQCVTRTSMLALPAGRIIKPHAPICIFRAHSGKSICSELYDWQLGLSLMPLDAPFGRSIRHVRRCPSGSAARAAAAAAAPGAATARAASGATGTGTASAEPATTAASATGRAAGTATGRIAIAIGMAAVTATGATAVKGTEIVSGTGTGTGTASAGGRTAASGAGAGTALKSRATRTIAETATAAQSAGSDAAMMHGMRCVVVPVLLAYCHPTPCSSSPTCVAMLCVCVIRYRHVSPLLCDTCH